MGEYDLKRLEEEGFRANGFALVDLKEAKEFKIRAGTKKTKTLKSVLVDISTMGPESMTVLSYLPGRLSLFSRKKRYNPGFRATILYKNIKNIEHAESPYKR